MSDKGNYDDIEHMEFSFWIWPPDSKKFTEGGIDRVLDSFIDAVEKEGYTTGGGVSLPPSEERTCKRCDGVGIVDPVPEERKCPTCEGTGEVDPDSMSKEEWDEVYDTEGSSK